jgi:hypothetical protein
MLRRVQLVINDFTTDLWLLDYMEHCRYNLELILSKP